MHSVRVCGLWVVHLFHPPSPPPPYCLTLPPPPRPSLRYFVTYPRSPYIMCNGMQGARHLHCSHHSCSSPPHPLLLHLPPSQSSTAVPSCMHSPSRSGAQPPLFTPLALAAAVTSYVLINLRTHYRHSLPHPDCRTLFTLCSCPGLHKTPIQGQGSHVVTCHACHFHYSLALPLPTRQTRCFPPLSPAPA